MTPQANAPTEGSSRHAWHALLFVVASVLCSLAALVFSCRRLPDPPAGSFDRRPLARLRAQRPDYVFLGNSMVLSRFDERALNKRIAPSKAVSLAVGGSMTALWYSQILNYIVPSGYRPRRLLIFFRNEELTRPRDQTTGKDLENIQRASATDSPVLAAKLVPPWRNPRERLHYLLWNALPTARLRRFSEPAVESTINRVSSVIGPTTESKNPMNDINALFRGPHWARDGGERPDPTDLDLRPIEQVASESLLPDILNLVTESQIPTVFVRVRTRARARGVPEPKALTEYVGGLRRYIEQRGAGFIDMSREDWESIELYGNGDHIADRYKAYYTRQFVAHEPDLFR